MKGRHRETEQLSVHPLYVLLYGLPMREELTAEGRPSSGDTGLGIAAMSSKQTEAIFHRWTVKGMTTSHTSGYQNKLLQALWGEGTGS